MDFSPGGNISECAGFQGSQSGWKQLLRADSKHFITFTHILFISLIFHRDLCSSLTDAKTFLHKASTKISFHVRHQQHCRLRSKQANRRRERTLLVCLWIQSDVFVSLNSSFYVKVNVNLYFLDFLPLPGLTVSLLDLWLVYRLWETAGVSGGWLHFCKPSRYKHWWHNENIEHTWCVEWLSCERQILLSNFNKILWRIWTGQRKKKRKT